MKCHSISSLDMIGGMSGADLSLVMQSAQQAGGLDNYLVKKYGVGSDLFFLYPSKYVPEMALVEGKLFTRDIEMIVPFLESIPPEPKFMVRWYHIFFGVLTLLIVLVAVKKRREKGI